MADVNSSEQLVDDWDSELFERRTRVQTRNGRVDESGQSVDGFGRLKETDGFGRRRLTDGDDFDSLGSLGGIESFDSGGDFGSGYDAWPVGGLRRSGFVSGHQGQNDL